MVNPHPMPIYKAVFERWVEQKSMYGWPGRRPTLLPLDPPHQLLLELPHLDQLMPWMSTTGLSHSPLAGSPASLLGTATPVDDPAIVLPSVPDKASQLVLELLDLTHKLWMHIVGNISYKSILP